MTQYRNTTIDGLNVFYQLRVTPLSEPDDVAELVAFLSSGRSRWMQGSIVYVDGGQSKGV